MGGQRLLSTSLLACLLAVVPAGTAFGQAWVPAGSPQAVEELPPGEFVLAMQRAPDEGGALEILSEHGFRFESAFVLGLDSGSPVLAARYNDAQGRCAFYVDDPGWSFGVNPAAVFSDGDAWVALERVGGVRVSARGRSALDASGAEAFLAARRIPGIAASASCPAPGELLRALRTSRGPAPDPRAASVQPGREWIREMIADPERAKAIAASHGVEWCRTEGAFRESHPEMLAPLDGVCPTQGDCDFPARRNAAIPAPRQRLDTVNICFRAVCEDDGSNCSASEDSIDAQLAQLGRDFAPSRIAFHKQRPRPFRSSRFRNLTEDEERDMKGTYASMAGTCLNVYIVNIEEGFMGLSRLPWDPEATGKYGGIIVDDDYFGDGQRTLTHETGHALGLWDTQRGISGGPNMDPSLDCGWGCYEHAGSPSDTTGDYCSDLDPTPTNFECAPPGGSDPCSPFAPWGPTQPEDFMSYAPDSCYQYFSQQQMGRMHCWLYDRLSKWIYREPVLNGCVALPPDVWRLPRYFPGRNWRTCPTIPTPRP